MTDTNRRHWTESAGDDGAIDHSQPDRPRLGEPRIFVEVIRQVEGTGQYLRSRKEISLRVWQDAKHSGQIVANEINACLRECEVPPV